MEGGKKPQIYFSISAFIVLLCIFQEEFFMLPIESLFPGHAIYYIITFVLRYPNSHQIRRILVTFSLSFGEVILTSLIFGADLHRSFTILITEFVVIYIAHTLLSPREIYESFKNKAFRTVVFNLEAIWRAILLVSAMHSVITIHKLSQYSIVLGVLIGVMKMATAAIVHVIDGFLCVDVPVREIEVSGVGIYFRNGIIVSTLSLILLSISETGTSYDILYETTPDYAKLITSIYFMLWYTHDSIEYGSFFK
ncbi:unnamed protein product [Blepharisma stoltei]|uniref:Uncharacterized protein n=1 Tax=Blepharisma stoltei TaxID=1481888 RepID=A0AAU9IR58_9CILI|nr:unnamed protein product [Blepharisma stoltei]